MKLLSMGVDNNSNRIVIIARLFWPLCLQVIGTRHRALTRYAPHGDRGATREYAVFSRLSEGQHTFFVRAASRGPTSGQSTADTCGPLTSGTGSGATYEYCGPSSNYSFLVDVTPPVASITTHWSPPLAQGGLGSQWIGYRRVGGGFLDYVGALQVFANANGRAFNLGTPNPPATNSTSFMVRASPSRFDKTGLDCTQFGKVVP